MTLGDECVRWDILKVLKNLNLTQDELHILIRYEVNMHCDSPWNL